MSKIPTEAEGIPRTESAENERDAIQAMTKGTDQIERVSRRRSHESLWGAMLFACMLLFVIVSVAFVGWSVYSGWKNNRLVKAEPSISVLSQQADEQQNAIDEARTSEGEQAKQSEEQANTADSTTAKKMAISVLNGGGAKGSAGVAATFLKGEGYTGVTAGNTLKDYAGVVIYFASGLDKEAEIIKATLVKKYPQAKSLPADVKNKETSVSEITVILGK